MAKSLEGHVTLATSSLKIIKVITYGLSLETSTSNLKSQALAVLELFGI